jgi:hypothetical protein
MFLFYLEVFYKKVKNPAIIDPPLKTTFMIVTRSVYPKNKWIISAAIIPPAGIENDSRRIIFWRFIDIADPTRS